MASNETAELMRAYASDDGTTFRIDFARAIVKMSNLGALTGSRGQIRLNCSWFVTSIDITCHDILLIDIMLLL